MRADAIERGEVRWTADRLLKRDVLSTVERGRLQTPDGEVDVAIRHLDDVPWWARPLARRLMARERKALESIRGLDHVPTLLFAGKDVLVRSWIDGLPLHIAQPRDDVAYFRHAKAVLRALHRRGVCHNDLAKPQNWLRDRRGRAHIIDFQLAHRFSGRGWLYRLARYEDLRHLLKQKKRYAESLLMPSERRMLARKSWPERAWMASGKRLYNWITRDVLSFADREGAGLRLINDAPSIATRLKSHPGVREAAVVAYPNRRKGTGLYAFVEAAPDVPEQQLIAFIAEGLGPSIAPEQLQVVDELPRWPNGDVRSDILQLVALNQIDQIDQLVATERDRAAVNRILNQRQNLADRVDGWLRY